MHMLTTHTSSRPARHFLEALEGTVRVDMTYMFTVDLKRSVSAVSNGMGWVNNAGCGVAQKVRVRVRVNMPWHALQLH
jgi:hypothetical protein